MANKKGDNRMDGLEKEIENLRDDFQKHFELMREERRLEKEEMQRNWERSQLEMKELREIMTKLVSHRDAGKSEESSGNHRKEGEALEGEKGELKDEINRRFDQLIQAITTLQVRPDPAPHHPAKMVGGESLVTGMRRGRRDEIREDVYTGTETGHEGRAAGWDGWAPDDHGRPAGLQLPAGYDPTIKNLVGGQIGLGGGQDEGRTRREAWRDGDKARREERVAGEDRADREMRGYREEEGYRREGWRDLTDEQPPGFGRQGDPRRDCRTRRVEMPVFDGEDPDGWIYRVERFFAVGRFNEKEKMELVSLSMEKRALSWFRWMEGRRPIRTWEECKGLLVEKFRPVQEGTPCQRLLAIKQTGTVDEYICRFEELVAPLSELPDEVLESSFLNGLSTDIRLELLIAKPRSLGRMMILAQQIEEKNKVMEGNRTIGYGGHKGWETTGEQEKGGGKAGWATVTDKGEGNFRRLTFNELQEKRRRGLCFKCDEKYTLGHQCKMINLKVLTVLDEATTQEEGLGGNEMEAS